MKKIILLFTLYLSTTVVNAQTVKILFDATKAETAGSADWVIDADLNNLNWSNKGTVSTSGGTHANAQQLPTPDQSTVTSSTVETYWNGALSSWGIDLVKKGYRVESLPYNGKITYGDKTNPQDLSNYKVYIVDEPNILFTAAEKKAMLDFVNNGGGLFIISDHAGSDRNSDGSDSPTIWNDLFTNNGIATNPFGITFDASNPNGKTYPSDITETSKHVSTSKNPITNGSFGTVSEIRYSGGTTMVIDNKANTSVTAVITANESTSSTSGVMCAYATYGKGKIVAIGDSSPSDDGSTTSPGTTVYQSYSGDATVGDNHRNLFMNSTIWLATSTVPVNLISFNAQLSNGKINLSWDVANELNFKGYSVEKSVDGVNYTAIGFLNATNNSTYAFTDASAQLATNYYRLKLVNNDGSFFYSNTIKVTATSNNLFSLYPNPVKGNENILVKIKALTKASTISLFDLAGKVIGTYRVATGVTNYSIPTTNLTKGTYIISIQTENNEVSSKEFIKK